MNEAIPARAIVIVTILRIPDKITGIASGSFILKRICILVLPIPFAASKIARSTFAIPVWVFLTIGKRAITAVAFPTPEKGIKKPSLEIDGIVYKKFIIPKVSFAVF